MTARRLADIDAIRRLAAEGHTAGAIAKQLGCSDTTIYRNAKAHGIALPRAAGLDFGKSEFWKQNDAELHRLAATGLSAAKIAAQLGTTKNAVVGRLTRLREREATEEGATRPERQRIDFPAGGACHWPLWADTGPGADGYPFCGARVATPGRPYCREHEALAWKRPAGQAIEVPG